MHGVTMKKKYSTSYTNRHTHKQHNTTVNKKLDL